MKLSILIPTFNRSNALKKNLELLIGFLANENISKFIEIVISNNNSDDNTEEVVFEIKRKYQKLKINYFSQTQNIGLKNNALFVLRKSKGEFIMYLGDDDFLDNSYLKVVIEHLQFNKNTKSIIPNYVPVDLSGIQIDKGRDDGLKNRVYKAGFKNCLRNSWRAHQLSGLVLKREGLYTAYKDLKVNNIYLFIFLLGFCCLSGDTLHLTSYPVKVTQPGQSNKDWSYGTDGLLNEVFDNYLKLPVNYFQKSLLQITFYRNQPWRLFMYKKKGLKFWLIAFRNIWFTSNSTLLFKILFPITITISYLQMKVQRLNVLS